MWRQSLGTTFPAVRDDGTVWPEWDYCEGAPAIYLVDRDWKVAWRYAGIPGASARDEVFAEVDGLMAQ